MRRAAVFLGLIALVSTSCATESSGIRVVDRFDAELRLEPDGTIDVREQIVVRTDPASPAVFIRVIADGWADEFASVSASIDGGQGPPARQVSVESGSQLAVEWRLPASSATSHTLELRYRAVGTVEVHGMRGTLAWAALPGTRTYPITSARIAVALPPGTRALRSPDIDASGWLWTETLPAFVATKSDIAPHEPGILHADLALDAVPMNEPRWQTRAAFAQQLTPSFIAAGLFILVTGAGILWAIRLQYFRTSSAADDARLSQRQDVTRSLRTAGIVVVVFGLVVAGVCYTILRSLGQWPQAVSVSIVVVGVSFVAASRWFLRRT